MTTDTNNLKPPKNTTHIWGVKDLTGERRPGVFEITNSTNEPFNVRLEKRDRQVAETINKYPLFCASPVRLSDSVMRLRRDHGLEIETEIYTGENGNYGAYFLRSKMRLVSEDA